MKIGIGDWFLARSEAFRHMIGSVRDHKISTSTAFKKVKDVHRRHEQRFLQHESRIRQMEKLLSALQEAPSPTKIIKSTTDTRKASAKIARARRARRSKR
jgi:hypothetical protein